MVIVAVSGFVVVVRDEDAFDVAVLNRIEHFIGKPVLAERGYYVAIACDPERTERR